MRATHTEIDMCNAALVLILDAGDVYEQIPFAVEIFESHTDGVSDTLIFAFETPGGFWTIGWHVPVELFTQEPDLFFLFLQTLRLSPKDISDVASP